MHLFDWIILALPILIVLVIGIRSHYYMKSVADFMSGGRLAGRYLLAVARGEMASGAVVFVSTFEVISHAGFTMMWWQKLTVPIFMIVGIFGFVSYRYRETKAMTLAQFFEIRYNKSFRIFTGMLGFLAGILNFGIIPAVGSRFLVYFLGFPATLTVFDCTFPTYIPLMALLLTITVILTLSGGLVTVMITDCVEGIMSQIFFVIIIAALLLMFNWTEISQVLMNRPQGESFLNPLDTTQAHDFNIWLVIMTTCTAIYGKMAWQNASAYNSAAITAHESRMGGILGHWREMGKNTVVVLLAVCGMTFLGHPDFVGSSEHAWSLINAIPQDQIQRQMQIPIAVSEMLPVCIKGLLCAVLVMGVFGGDSTHLHSWGGILVQDVFAPLRKKPLSPTQHIFFLRLSIISVAIFAFLFGAAFRQTEYVTMWFQVTTGVFVGGAGAAIIGGLYWKKGTSQGAWTAILLGSILSLVGIAVRSIYGRAFPLNGAQVFFTVSLVSSLGYIIASLLTCKKDFDMDRMLYRGAYADPQAEEEKKRRPKLKLWERIVGIDSNFTKFDKMVAWSVLGYGLFWFFIMLGGTLWNFISPWSIETWSRFWHVFAICVPVLFSFVTAIWFSWGGVRDISRLFARLKTEEVNHLDDGTVVNNQNLSDIAPRSSGAVQGLAKK